MNKKKQQAPLVNIGSSSLLVVFLVLCLITFAILSLVSANRDLGFSRQLAERRTSYYEAGNQAEAVVGQIDALLQQAYDEEPDRYKEFATEKIENEDFGDVQVTCTVDGNDTTVHFGVDINERQTLDVELVLADVEKENVFYDITKWNTVLSVEYNEEQKMNLIQMD